MKRTAKLVALLSVLSGALVGCSEGSGVSKAEEEAFRQKAPPMPESSRKAMEEARVKGAAQAEEIRRKTEERNRAAATTGG